MLPKKYRLSFKKGERKKTTGRIRFKGGFFDLVVSFKLGEVPKTQDSRWGFIISKKVSPKAVERNRLKRLLGENARYFLPQIRPGLELVILGKPVLAGRGLEEIRQKLGDLLRKADLFKK